MQKVGRVYAVKRNLFSAIVGIFINILYSFVSRKIFVMTLGCELVGLGSLMGNMTAVLSLLDFGAGSALCFSLYAPLAKNDTLKISAYLSFYRKLCIFSSSLTFVVGLFLLPYIKSTSDNLQSVTAFIIFLASGFIGSIFSAEKILLFSDQKNYITQTFSYVFGGIGVVVESIVLICTKNYILYLLISTALCLIEDIAIVWYTRIKYPEIRFFGVKDKNVQKKLFKEMIYIQPSNIAGTLLRTADNFLVVYLFGVATNGIYSNYNMILGYASMLSVVLTGSVAATVGNIGASESFENSERIFRMTSICSFFPVCICTCILFVMSGDIVTLWLDKTNAVNGNFSFILAFNFFIMGLKRSVSVFREGFGLYRKEKIKPFAELSMSLFLSVFFGKMLGLSGVYLGQGLAAFIVCIWYEPYILYKYGFSKSVIPYYLLMVKYFATAAISCICAFVICRYTVSFSFKALICTVLPLLFCIGAFYGREELKDAVKYFVKNKKKSVFIKEYKPEKNEKHIFYRIF
ncbi:MAG: hypothetical protein E7621_01805 [Ruminococcaceae bacterium]|nr:hypothetical protein [Oscillospiraceae bacterium]